MQSIDTQLPQVRARVAEAATAAGRDATAIRLLAVTKTRSADEIRAAHALGIGEVGESYLQEALPKIEALASLGLTWHFIGAVQSNKTRDIARHFQWVQTVDRLRIAERLARQRPGGLGALDVLIQVNIDREPQKAGVLPEALAELAAAVAALPSLRLRGLMAIPRVHHDAARARASFAAMAALFHRTRPDNLEHWDTLSMGMTNDYPLAIAEGATLVRIGTALFGPRPAPARTRDGHRS